MPILTGLEVFGGLAVLFAVTVPLGIVLLRALEAFVGRSLPLTSLERVIVAFYGTGGVLFVFASIPLPLFVPLAVAAILGIGVVAFLILSIRERGRSVREFFRWLRSGPAIAVLLGTLGLLILYITTIGSLNAANGLDGPVHSLFTMLLLRNHTVASTLLPYELSGVEYPQGAPVWEALPAILYGWPVMASPVVLPALFLSLTPAAAFCWGERAGKLGTPRGARMGLLFGAFFGLLASWPRLLVGGSYDFEFALPLFLVTLGWLPALVKQPTRPWREILAIGLLLGVSASLSASVAVELALLLGAGWLTHLWHFPRDIGRVALRYLAVAATGFLFLIRSFYGLVIWSNYPHYILSAAGSPPWVLSLTTQFSPYRLVTGELDPFIPWKYKLSPIPYLSLELGCLLALGLIVMALWYRRPSGRVGRCLPAPLVTSMALGTVSTFVFVAFLVAVEYINGPLAFVRSVVYLEEISFLLFIFYESIALLPLVASLDYLEDRKRRIPDVPEPMVAVPRDRSSVRHWRRSSARSIAWPVVAAVVILGQPLALGAAASATSVPDYLTSHVEQFANVTAADFEALEWAGTHLPSCSRVLPAPGSAANYLPEYGSVYLIAFQAFQWNLSYNEAVQNLTNGVYSPSTHGDLLSISTTEVFVTGQTTVQFPPFLPGPLEDSLDFTELFHMNDAFIFAFLPGIAATSCPA